MKNLNKILIIPVILSCFILNSVFAADNTDCWEFWGRNYSEKWSFEIVNNVRETQESNLTNFLSVSQQRNIITKNDLNTAILNLKKFCCENQLWELTAETCKKDEPYFNDNALDSQYLFDHLFDVIMRRLNWLTSDLDIYTKTHMTTDDMWTERREWINSQAESTAWSTPQTIINKYQKYWKQTPSSKGYNITSRIYATFWNFDNQTFLTYVSWKWTSSYANDSEIVANAFKNYDKRTLYDRYINACALAEYFYALLDVWVNSKDKKISISRLSDNSCDKVVERQIDWENNYVILVIQKSSNLFLSNYVKWYMAYMYERQRKLQKLWKEVTDRWIDIVRAVPNLEKRTVK